MVGKLGAPFTNMELTIIPAWISYHMPSKCGMKFLIHSQTSNGCTVEVWECISNSIPHFIMDEISYLCWLRDLSQSMLVKGAPSSLVEGICCGNFNTNLGIVMFVDFLLMIKFFYCFKLLEMHVLLVILTITNIRIEVCQSSAIWNHVYLFH